MDGRVGERSPGRENGGSARDEPQRGRRVRVGLLADPGAPTDLARSLVPDLSAVLAEQVDETIEWVVSADTCEVPLDEQGRVPLESLAREQRARQEWDVVIVVTDLPRRLGTRPVATVVSDRARSGLVSLPGSGQSVSVGGRSGPSSISYTR